MNHRCSVCKEQDFEFILFRQKGEEVYHYHYYWTFEMTSRIRPKEEDHIFWNKNKEEILEIILEKFSGIEIIALYCAKCAKKGLTKYEFFRKFHGDKPLCYFCNKSIYKIKETKHPLLIGFNAIRRYDGQNLLDTRAFHRDRALYD